MRPASGSKLTPFGEGGGAIEPTTGHLTRFITDFAIDPHENLVEVPPLPPNYLIQLDN